MMQRFFNTTGPCKPEMHYMLSPIVRLPDIVQLIDQANYFVIHAPRQTGKSTAMLALGEQLTVSGKYTALMVSAEVGQPFSYDIGKAERAMLGSWRQAAEDDLPDDLHPPAWPDAENGERIQSALRAWAKQSPRPLVILIDEIDALRDEALLSVLRQLRSGFPRRPKNFPQSMGLIGLRDVRDYKIASGGSDHLNTSSPFNIKVGSFTLRNFNVEEVAELYAQHTSDTRQVFTPDAIELAFELTQGQPWLVNALAKEVVEKQVTDRTVAITPEDFQIAKEILIRRKDTHLDSLAERLREDRVRRVVAPILAGQELELTEDDDRDFLVDLGLLRRSTEGGLVIANPIYREILPRMLAQGPQDSLPQISPTWLSETGELKIDALREAFMAFWLQHGEPLLNSAAYHEIAPHLVLMAFLHRVINGGGTLEREYAIGRDRMDLCLQYGAVTLGIEIKVQRDDRRNQLKRGLDQIDGYLTRLKLDFGWLVIFDRRANILPIEERLRSELYQSEKGRSITVIFA